MKKIVAIGDSLALPGHANRYEDTWFYQLQRRFHGTLFIPYFRRGLTTAVLVTE